MSVQPRLNDQRALGQRLPVTRRLAVAVVFFMLVVAAGTLGYILIEDAAPLDAVYLTVITVFAVGFGETIPLDPPGRVFTIALIVLGIGGFTFVTVTVIEFLVEGHLQDIVGRRRMERTLQSLRGHTIVCGYGRVGRQVIADLVADDRPVVVVELDPDRAAAARSRNLIVVHGNASREAPLLEAGLARAAGLAACTNDDAENVLIALTVKLLRPEVFIVVRLKDAENEAKAYQAGADRVIAPSQIGGRRIAALLSRPYVVDFLDVVTHGSDVDLVLEEIAVGERSPLVGQTLATAGLRERFGANVLAIRQRDAARPSTKPSADTALTAGDLLVVIGSREDLDRLQAHARA